MKCSAPRSILVLACLLVVSDSLLGQSIQSSFSPDVHPIAMAVGDFNRDGKLDLAVTGCNDPVDPCIIGGASSNGVRTFLGNGNGKFTFKGSYFVGTPTGMAASDINVGTFARSVSLGMTLLLVVPNSMAAQESPPGWARKTFPAPPDRVFDAALKSIAAQPYEIAAKNDENKTVRFIVGKSAFSWGYVMVLTVSPGVGDTSNVSVEVTRLRGPDGRVSIVASGKKEVQKVLRGMEKELAAESTTDRK